MKLPCTTSNIGIVSEDWIQKLQEYKTFGQAKVLFFFVLLVITTKFNLFIPCPV